MTARRRLLRRFCFALLLTGIAGSQMAVTCAPNDHEVIGKQTFASPQSNPIATSPAGDFVYVANTTSNSVSVLSTAPMALVQTVKVGLEPVGLALRPDGLELWVANHVSDSVSVIDTDPTSASYLQVVETIQTFDASGATTFDEPVGIAFASNTKAYVSLSSRDQVAIIDGSYQVTGSIFIRSQEPRALAVRNGLLYVAAFESGNQSQLSACSIAAGTNGVGDPCSLGLTDLQVFATQPNIPGRAKNIITDTTIPDRDLYVFDTTTELKANVISGLGTLLYGLAVDGSDNVYVTQTDALNLVNGNHGDVLDSLGNLMFDNEIAKVNCTGGTCGTPQIHAAGGITPADALATPYGVALCPGDTQLVMTAASSSRLALFDPASLGTGPQDVISVGSIPRGVACATPPGSGVPTAFVLNTLANTVSAVEINGNAFGATQIIGVGNDPTRRLVRLGRIAFNNGFAATNGTFSCASCHPDGNTDQLLWRIGGDCTAIGCDPGNHARTTMPIRGLQNTLPLHWDGTLGDPFGGGNGEVGVAGAGGTDCSLAGGPHACFLDLVQASLNGVMCDQSGSCPGTELSAKEQDDMATFLASVSYPPARARRVGDNVSSLKEASPPTVGTTDVAALQGFADFFMNQNGGAEPRSCADSDAGCHELPLGTATNSATLNGFDAPTMRGLTDRPVQFSLGITSAVPILLFANAGFPLQNINPLEPEIQYARATGIQEITTFGAAFGIFEGVYGVRPLHTFQMFEEASTGLSGAVGRQLTLNTTTASDADTIALMTDLEAADVRGVVNLQGNGLYNGVQTTFSFKNSGNYETPGTILTPAALRADAQTGVALITLTAQLRWRVGQSPQPLLSSSGTPGSGPVDDPPIPDLGNQADPPAFNVTGTDVMDIGVVLVDGAVTTATLTCVVGVTDGFCDAGDVAIDLDSKPTPDGPHLLQVLNPGGLLSNELPICVGNANGCLTDL